MLTIRRAAVACMSVLLGCARPEAPPSPPSAEAELGAYIATIKAVDHHAHPMRPVTKGAPPDSEYDALPLDGIPPFPMPWRLTLDNPEWTVTARALYSPASTDTGTTLRQTLKAARARVIEERGQQFPEWVLDQSNIEVMFANRIVLSGLNPARFRWVPFADALMLPLDTKNEAARTPDTRSLYPREAALLKRYLHELGLASLPRTLDDYVSRVVAPTLARQHTAGAVAIKFEAAYLRALDFDRPDSVRASRIYARYVSRGTPTRAEYKTLEDYLFYVIARAAGHLGLAVHIHVLDAFGGFYSARGSTPLVLEPVFNDSALRGTTFVMLHGGWPYIGQTESMITRPNVYVDISMMDQILEPSRLALVLRQWLGRAPDKVLFGSDAFDGGPDQGWGDVAAFATTSARKALTIALNGMVQDGEATPERARQLARMVLRENANNLYRLGLR
jgi:hypothetical protein